ELPSRFTGDLVFPGKDGQAILPENWLKRVFHPAVRRARIPHVTFHSLRDTYAAMVVMAEKNPKYLQAQMGHASIRTTMDDYGGLFEEANPAAAARLERVFLAESGDKVVTKEQRVGG
ncbi:MAG: tyrosine-type recombinase/integrase, partial [Nitrospinota bacterium]